MKIPLSDYRAMNKINQIAENIQATREVIPSARNTPGSAGNNRESAVSRVDPGTPSHGTVRESAALRARLLAVAQTVRGTHKCDECGEVYEYYSWFTVILGKCDDCTRKAWEKALNSRSENTPIFYGTCETLIPAPTTSKSPKPRRKRK